MLVTRTLVFSLSRPVSELRRRSKTCFPTCMSRADSGSSSRKTSASE